MTSRIIAVDPFDLVVFGATGDLAYRKLLPALYHRHRDEQLPDVSRIIAASRRKLSDDDYRKLTEEALTKFVPAAEREPEQMASFLARISYVSVDAKIDDSGWADLARVLESGADRVRAFYLAVSPGPLRRHLRGHRRPRPDHAEHPRHHREADRQEPQVAPRR